MTYGFNPMRLLNGVVRGLCVVVLASLMWQGASAYAASIDPYVARYLEVAEPVELSLDSVGATKAFSGVQISEGKRLFEENCKNCHVGGSTLPNPPVSLSLEALKGAAPPRDTINALVAFIRQPMSYDGTEETYVCRDVSERWMGQDKVENLAAFILRAAQKAPKWGTSEF